MFAKEIGLDLGTATVSVFVRGRGIVLQEPSLAAVDRSSGELRAVGSDAAELLGRSSGGFSAVRPIRGGVISDAGMAERMIKAYLKKVLGGSPFKPELVISVPIGISEVEERAVINAGMQAGARRVRLVESPVAAALGAGLDISGPVGVMVADIGAGTCDTAVLSLGGIVESASCRAGGERFDEALIRYLRRRAALVIGERTAEEIKLAIGCVTPQESPASFSVRGRDLSSGFPRSYALTSEEIREAYAVPAEEIVEAIRLVLERTPPELAADIARDGIYLTGGGSQLVGLPALIAERIGIPAQLAGEASSCAVLGLGAILGKQREPSSNRPQTLKRMRVSKA